MQIPAGAMQGPSEASEVRASVIIPLYGRLDLTKQCVEALAKSWNPADELILVDNDSPDGTTAWLKREVREFAHVICNEVNRNYSGANNDGAKLARGEYLVLLNNDTLPEAGWLEPLIENLQVADTGAVGARLVYPDDTIQHAGVWVHPFHLQQHAHVGLAMDDPQVIEARDVQVVTGACLALRRDLYEELGGLDEGFVNGCEDVELCYRIRRRGLQIRYEPRTCMTHFESQSAGRFALAKKNVDRMMDLLEPQVVVDIQGFIAIPESLASARAAELEVIEASSEHEHINERLLRGEGGYLLTSFGDVSETEFERVFADANEIWQRREELAACEAALFETRAGGVIFSTRKVIDHCGGFNPSLTIDEQPLDWLNRVQLFGHRTKRFAESGRELYAYLWHQVDEPSRGYARLWGALKPANRVSATCYPLIADVVDDAQLDLELQSKSIALINWPGELAAFRAAAEELLRANLNRSDLSILVRISDDGDAELGTLEAIADQLESSGAGELPDIVITEATAAQLAKLAMTVTDLHIFGSQEHIRRLESLRTQALQRREYDAGRKMFLGQPETSTMPVK